ncbi:YczE/YyaS/YitT family protein [Paenisporosarcina indica]|uniref:YczE/YyaS/YitT family protein n=1 Tax=Paenisporosarcina indica TaxID=650093 RepID=UPI00094FA56F|nr:membrane protein [Paenisporosarcina indica]
MKNRVIIALFYLIGLTFLSLGISLMIIADLGAGAWDAMYVGLSDKLGLSVGTWIFIVGILLILLNGLIMKRIPDFSAIITIFLIGVFMDVWLLVVFSEFTSAAIAMRVFMMIAGIVICAIGIASYLQSNFARNPMDSLMVAIQYRTGKSLWVSKMSMELTVLVIAFFVSGPIGVGTVLMTILIGPLIQLFFSPVTRIREKLCAVQV